MSIGYRTSILSSAYVSIVISTRFFAVFHSTDLFSVPLGCRSRVYVPVADWWRWMDPDRLLQIPIPLVFAYYSDRILSGTAVHADDISRISRSDFAVLDIICFLGAARYLLT